MVTAVTATPDRGPVPTPLRRAAVVVLLQGVGLVLLCAAYAGHVVTGRPANRALALSGAGLGLAAGLVVVLLARSLGRGRRVAGAPVLLTELLALPIGVGLLQSSLPLYGAAVVLPAAGVLLLLFGTRGGRTIFGS